FNRENDPVKTEKYLNTSTTHLKKLSTMVEKILETATLDSDELPLNREEIDLDALLRTLVGKYQNLHHDKKMTYKSWKETLKFKADAFHLENAMNNLLDNAVKYGGDEIDVLLGSQGGQLKISVQDNGHQLEKEQAKRLFDKFYRVPKGNTHNVKGFG